MTDLGLISLSAGYRSAADSLSLHCRNCIDCDWGTRQRRPEKCCATGYRLWQDVTKATQALRDYERELAQRQSDQLLLW